MTNTHWSIKDFEDMNITIVEAVIQGTWIMLVLHNGIRIKFKNWEIK